MVHQNELTQSDNFSSFAREHVLIISRHVYLSQLETLLQVMRLPWALTTKLQVPGCRNFQIVAIAVPYNTRVHCCTLILFAKILFLQLSKHTKTVLSACFVKFSQKVSWRNGKGKISGCIMCEG